MQKETNKQNEATTFVTPSGQTFSTAFVPELLDRCTPEYMEINLTKVLDMCTDHIVNARYTVEGSAGALEALRIARNIFRTNGESINLE
ncbi:hypothetical protein [Pontibacter populi]|uniref:Uncharacterized protein n=1 Tax=Pontibacter populi TaxID=890055 RepID=A0ABV1RPP1_9BACT